MEAIIEVLSRQESPAGRLNRKLQTPRAVRHLELGYKMGDL